MAFCHLPFYAQADDDALKPRGEVGVQTGSSRSIATTEMWIPLQQRTEDVLFADVRLMGDNHQNREGNVGIGYRRVTENPVLGKGVAGVHGWVDKRYTEHGNQVYQATVGVEWLGEDVDLRANAYVPLTKKQAFSTPNIGQASAYLVGTGLYVDTLGTSYEEPQKGVDAEIGIPVKPLEKIYDSARVYAGGYYFDGASSDKVAGWRARAAIDVTQDFSMGARIQRDHERGTQSFLEATVRFPFNHKKSFRREGLRARLDDNPVRDVDIVTGTEVESTGLANPVINTASGTAVTVLHVDNTAPGGGDGTQASPFNTLAAAQAAATAGSVIYVHTGNGTSAGQNAGITLAQAGQSLVGAGTGLVWDGDKFSTGSRFQSAPKNTTIIASGAAPVITNAAGNAVTITADNVKVSGLTINGATARGISASNVDNLKITDITVTGNAQGGIYLEANGASASLDNLYINNITASANNTATAYKGADVNIRIQNGGRVSSPVISNVTGSNTIVSNKHSVMFDATDGGTVTSPRISNITSTGNGYRDTLIIQSTETVYATGADFEFSDAVISDISGTSNLWEVLGIYLSNGSANNMQVSGLSATNGGYGALYIYNDGGSVMDDMTISDVTSTGGSSYSAFYVSANDGAVISDFTVSDATIANHAGYGMAFESYNYATGTGAGTISNVSVSDVTLTGSTGRSGFAYYTNDTRGSVFSARVENMTSTGNAQYGVRIENIGTGASINLDLGGGTLGSAGNNSIYSNTLDDLYVDLDGGELKAENNWWGVNTGLAPARITSVGGSTVDASPHLTSDPN